MSAPAWRWLVSGDGPRRLEQLLEQRGEPAAVAEGRVFVNGQRCVAGAADALQDGDVVEVYAPRAVETELTVLYRDAHLAVVAKPAGIASEPERAGGASLRALAEQELGPVHVVTRLDRGVSGVVVLALSGAARRALAEQRPARRYVAIASGAPSAERGSWQQSILRGQRQLAARTDYVVVARRAGHVVLDLKPATGRTHQLRIHAASSGLPLLGDRAHGGGGRVLLPDGQVRALARVALHAYRVELDSPSGARVSALAELPGELLELWRELGGRDEDWRALGLAGDLVQS